MHTADIVVVGGGPSGSAAALLLARRGHEVLLVDQARFPRDKPCGEYLNPAAVAVLARLGVTEALWAAGARRVAGVLLGGPAGRTVRVPYPAGEGYPRSGLSVPRLALDAALLWAAGAAGASIREGFRVDDLLTEGRRVVGLIGRSQSETETIRARLVLAADGTRSLVARRLGLTREPPIPRRFGLVAHYQDVAGDDWVEMHAGRQGYCGLGYSADGGANVAMVVGKSDLPRLRGRAEAFFDERLAEFPAIARRVASGRRTGRLMVTGSMSSRIARAAVPGVLLLGDAAGFYDPFTGEGLSYALRGAELAATAAAAALCSEPEVFGLNHEDTKDTMRYDSRDGGRSQAGALRKCRAETAASPAPPFCRCSSGPSCLRGSVCTQFAEAAAFREYSARRQAEFGPRVLVSRLIQAVLARPWALESVFRHFEADPTLAQRLIGVTAGILPPRVVMTPDYLARLLLPTAGVQVFGYSGVQGGPMDIQTPEHLNT